MIFFPNLAHAALLKKGVLKQSNGGGLTPQSGNEEIEPTFEFWRGGKYSNETTQSKKI